MRALTALIARQSREELKRFEALQHLIQESEAHFQVSKDALGDVQQHIARLEYNKANRTEAATFSADYDTRLSAKAERHELSPLIGQIKMLEANKAEQRDLHVLEESIKECELSSVKSDQFSSLGKDVHTAAHQITALRLDLQDFHRRLGVFVEQAKRRMPEPFTLEQIEEMTTKGQDFLDSLYLAFEDRFRGGFEDVRSGLRVYLPYIRQAFEKAAGAPVLDVACGRGEWLDLLREEGIKARGVDLNGAAIELCSGRGLEVSRNDAFAYLREQPKNSFSAMTSFHFIEHLDYRSWIVLLDEALRILKPGGIALFETPNARNILTTTGDFYRDPTHNRPVFPETIELIAELRGFFESEVFCFSEDRSALIPLADYRFDRLEDYVSISRDVVWMGIKS